MAGVHARRGQAKAGTNAANPVSEIPQPDRPKVSDTIPALRIFRSSLVPSQWTRETHHSGGGPDPPAEPTPGSPMQQPRP